MNYIGSKWSLLPYLRRLIHQKKLTGTFCDLFAGTTAVGQEAKRCGFAVISNDWQEYSFVLGRAYLCVNDYPDFASLRATYPDIFNRPSLWRPDDQPPDEPLRKVLSYLNELPGIDTGFVYNNYCAGGTRHREHQRQYFSDENGRRCDAIRQTLAQWRVERSVDENEYYLLLAALLESIDRVANTASVYAAFLKHIKHTARRPLELRMPRIIPSTQHHQVYKEDANAVIRRLSCDVLYIDPPYNQRQYAANYHVLETIAANDRPLLSGKTGLRPYTHQKSRYCTSKSVAEAFAELLENARARHIIVSYNDEGLLAPEELRKLLEQRGPTDVQRIPYRRFRADIDRPSRRYSERREVNELFFYTRVADSSIVAA